MHKVRLLGKPIPLPLPLSVSGSPGQVSLRYTLDSRAPQWPPYKFGGRSIGVVLWGLGPPLAASLGNLGQGWLIRARGFD